MKCLLYVVFLTQSLQLIARTAKDPAGIGQRILSKATVDAPVTAAFNVKELFAKHGVNWGHISNYEGRYTVQGILHRFFPSNEGKKVLAALGFGRGIVPSEVMLDSLRLEIENDPTLINTKDWQEPLRRLAISTKVEQLLTELTESQILADDSLTFSQRGSLQNVLALRDSYVAMNPETIDLAIEAVTDNDQQILSSLIESKVLDPNLPIVSGLPLVGFATRRLSALEGQLATSISIGYADQQKLNRMKEKIDASIEQLKWLVDHPRVDLDVADSQGRTLVGIAARTGSLNALKIMLGAGVDIDSTDNQGNSPLMTLIRFASISREQLHESVQLLIREYNASVTISNYWGTTALHEAVLFESILGGDYLTNLLLDQGADINAYSRLQGRPLDIAERERNSRMIDLLVKHGAKATHRRGTLPPKP